MAKPTDPADLDFPSLVHATRVARGETQREFAISIQLHWMTISRWERGETIPLGGNLPMTRAKLEKMLIKARRVRDRA